MSTTQPRPLTFVVSSGRCGSTMLSRILHRHPDVLSASEYMNSMRTAMGGSLFTRQELTGEMLRDVLSAIPPDGAHRRGAVAELFKLAYPYDSGRFRLETGIPWLCHFMLPLLSDDPDALLDELIAEVPSWPARPPADQYRAILEYLAGRLGRRVIVERSGGSSAVLTKLFAHYPDARFVHMHRDGPDSALSMSKFPTTRAMVLTALAASAAGVPATAPLDEILAGAPEEFRSLLGLRGDVDQFMAYPMPVSHFGNLWSGMMTQAAGGLSQLPKERWTSLKYERLVAAPRPELTRLAEFIGVPATPRWLDDACGMVSTSRTGSAAAELDADALAALRAACEPGERILATTEEKPCP